MKKGLILMGLAAVSWCTLSSMKGEGKCKEVTCTTQYVREGIVILDSDGEPVELDDAYTYDRSTGEKIRFKDFKVGDAYTVMDDSYQDKLKNRSTRFQFVGIRNGKRIISEPFVFSADCCHVIKQVGKDTIVIERQ